MRKMFFCYERNMFNNWNPVLVFDDYDELVVVNDDRRQVIEIDREQLPSIFRDKAKWHWPDLLYYLESVYPLKVETNDENRSPNPVPDD